MLLKTYLNNVSIFHIHYNINLDFENKDNVKERLIRFLMIHVYLISRHTQIFQNLVQYVQMVVLHQY